VIDQDQHFIDIRDILIATRDTPRDKALQVRNKLRDLLRAVEDLHDFPHSFQTKVERGEVAPKQGHHNR
jgi:hypothetical protein